MSIDDIKRHGAMLSLEAELNVRIGAMKSCYEHKEWTSVYSHAEMIKQLSEELRKLYDAEPKPNRPNPPPAQTR